MRKIPIILTAGALLVALPPTSVGATPPDAVHFEVPTTIPTDGGPTSGPFTASGPAVVSGLMCDSGETVDVFGKAAGFQSGNGVNFQVIKLFTCGDGSGDFLVKLQVRIDRQGDNFNWTVVGGTDAYEDLHGSGRGVGLPDCGADCVVDVYDGRLHVD
jgi:hypothetical protein